MALYRVVQSILFSNGDRIEVGHVGPLSRLTDKAFTSLLRKGVISEVAPPPLNILPGWQEPAKKLEWVGVETAVDFLDADDEVLAEVMDVSPEVVAEKKEELLGLVMPPFQPSRQEEAGVMQEEASVVTDDDDNEEEEWQPQEKRYVTP